MGTPNQEELKAEVKKLLDPYLAQQADALNRVARLIELSERISAPPMLSILGSDAKGAAQDVLRAAVVLIHAHLEEFLRTIAAVLLPEGDEERLNEIPLVGLGGRKQNFPLGKLVPHRGKTIDSLLRASVAEYLERSNYNSKEDIGNLLKSLGFKISNHNKEFGAIQQMIERRHQIAHRADRFELADTIALKPIGVGDVSRWHTATQAFLDSLYLPLLVRLIKLKSKMITITEPEP